MPFFHCFNQHFSARMFLLEILILVSFPCNLICDQPGVWTLMM